MDPNETVVFPDDTSTLTREQLQSLQTQALAEFDTLATNEDIDDAGVARLEVLASGIESLTTAITAFDAKTVTAENTGKNVDDIRAQVAKCRTTKKPTTSPAITASVTEPTEHKTASLAVASANAPIVPAKTSDQLVITAAAATSGVQIGSQFDDSDSLVAAMQSIARSLAPSHGNPSFQSVASIANNYEHVVDLSTKPNDIEALLRDVRSRDNQEALVAGGGWCAPSEIRYDFFNIACQDGMVDLPTIGIRRGGLQYPVSPSLADVFTGTFTNATNPWLWTEVDDIAAATGSPTKPCVRVACPDFDEARLECYGICLTAGNLTDYAYPEATRNHLSLLMAAHYHAMNQRYLTQMVTLSTFAGEIPATSGTGILSDAPAATALAANDYRQRFGMCDDDILEVIFPRWVKDAMRIDHLRRNGFWASPLSTADINKLFTANRLRVQWVNDWQVRSVGQPGNATPLVDWPTTVDFMIYAAGTFIRGNGLSLDLGVVRDSVLNETNDHTAAWTEECHLIAMVGHESRYYTIPVCTAGRTGANDIGCGDVGGTTVQR